MLKGKGNLHIIISDLAKIGTRYKTILNKIINNKEKIKIILFFLFEFFLFAILIICPSPEKAQIIHNIFCYIAIYLLIKCYELELLIIL